MRKKRRNSIDDRIDFSNDKILGLFANFLKEEYSIDLEGLKRLIDEKRKEESAQLIPVSVFKNKKLSTLEIVVKYLRERFGLSFRKIGELLNRKTGTVSSTYMRAKTKQPEPLEFSKTSFYIPISIFRDRKFSSLEAIVHYLKSLNLTHHEIAVLLEKDDSTIWTVYARSKKK